MVPAATALLGALIGISPTLLAHRSSEPATSGPTVAAAPAAPSSAAPGTTPITGVPGPSAGVDPPVRFSGDAKLVVGGSLDLDATDDTWEGQGAAGAEIYGGGGHRVGVDFRTERIVPPAAGPVSFAACHTSGYYKPTAVYNLDDMKPGLRFCMRTTEERCALVQVLRAAESADLHITTWDRRC